MWGTVLLMGFVVAVDPAQVGAVAYFLARPRAMRLLSAYFIGGFGVSLIAGGVILFLLDGVGIGQGSSIPPELEIAVGVLALVVATLVGTGIAHRLRERVPVRHAGDRSADEPPSGHDAPPGLEKLPGFDKLPRRLQDVIQSESPWIAWVYGVAFGMPSAYYLAAIAAILKSGVGTSAQIGALVVFNLVAFAVAAVPLACFAVAPGATRARIDQLSAWVGSHQRLVVTTVGGAVGVYLVLMGVSKL